MSSKGKKDLASPSPPPPPSPLPQFPSLPSSPVSQPSTTVEAPSTGQYELRIYGLNPAVTTDNLVAFFSANIRVLGVLLHPQHGSLQWAQLWVSSQDELQRCLSLRRHLAPSGITISQAPSLSQPPLPTNQGLPTPELSVNPLNIEIRAPPTPPSYSRNSRADIPIMGYRHVDPHGPLPRNLYVMGLPLDLTQVQFKAIFQQFGMVEHSTLLSQLDGMGRRRGFILMSTHREAQEAMNKMNGQWVEIDVSWALVQRESKNIGPSSFGPLPNRVIHPPTVPTRRGPAEDCSVLVENLDSFYFPSAGAVREIFSNFGPVARVSILCTEPFQALIQFEHNISATALLNANGLSIGGRPVVTRRYIETSASNMPTRGHSASARLTFDPFDSSDTFGQRFSNLNLSSYTQPSGLITPTSLNANSEPFVPLPSTAMWLSQSSDTQQRARSRNHFDSPKTENTTSSSGASLNNSHSDSTKASAKINSKMTPTSKIQPKVVEEDTPRKKASTQDTKGWPSMPSSASRWSTAPNFCEL